ncbi:MAG: nicotinamide riboside transporter PnuC [Muribaculaceae bacterium]|nr:nicotinamide riboside transporter PnuC [Muribaculaceae bacterium]
MTFDLNTLLDIFKVGVGLVYLYLEYHARPSMWVASVIMPAIGLVLFWNKGLYADCAINCYYLIIAVYGFIAWTRHSHKKDKGSGLRISHTPSSKALILLGCLLLIWGCIAFILHKFIDSTVIFADSLTTSMSIIGMWMLARKYVEQWLVWFVVDAIYVWLYYKKQIYFSGSLYVFYTIMALFGYRRWSKQIAPTSHK